MSLAERIAQTPTGKTLDLGSETIPVEQANPAARSVLNPRRPMTIVGDGATIVVKSDPFRRRNLATILTGAPDLSLLGDVTIHHDDDADRGAPDLEGQHAIQLQGALRFRCQWKVENAVSNTVYVGRDSAGHPSFDLDFSGMRSTNAGRQHFAFIGSQRARLTHAVLDTCGRGHSSIVFEPNGMQDCCRDLLVQDVRLKGNTGWCFSGAGGVGRSGLVQVTYQRVWSQDGPFGIKITHGPGPAIFDQCGTDEITHRATVVASGLEALYVTGYHQPASPGVELFDVTNVAHFVHSLAA